jgi:predicted house-cleaning noncanonical NTP pyrophosphatase (MazG superfamily)
MTRVTAHFDNIRNEILEVLRNSESSIKICMAWFTDNILMQALLSKLDEALR